MARNNVVEAYRPAGSSQTVAYTGTAGTISNAVNANQDTLAYVFCTTAAYIAVGAAPTATTSNGVAIPANIPIILDLRKGEKVSAIQVASGGSLYVSEITH